MKLNKLFTGIEYQLLKGDLELEITDLIIDSRKVAPNTLFIAIPGSEVDGHNYITDAIKNDMIFFIFTLPFISLFQQSFPMLHLS